MTCFRSLPEVSANVAGRAVEPFPASETHWSCSSSRLRGTVEFELAGRTHTLEALGESDDLFLIFKDGTTGRDTYAAGRYLYAPVVGGETVTLDFNKAYNPPCAFTPYATCPLPPSGNTIAAAIEAGERGYHLEQYE